MKVNSKKNKKVNTGLLTKGISKAKIKNKAVKAKNVKRNLKKANIQNGFKSEKIVKKTKNKRKNVSKVEKTYSSDDGSNSELSYQGEGTINKKEDNLFNDIMSDNNSEEDKSDNEMTENYEDEVEAHKKSLERLKEVDPEFYQFLEENDKKLLNFDVSDDEDAKSTEQDEIDPVHKPSTEMEVASDESDFEPEDDQKEEDKRTITLKMLKEWQAKLHTDKSNQTIGCVIQAFHAALVHVSNQQDESPPVYKVEGSAIFNAVIQLCVLELGPAVRRFLGLTRSKQPHKCKRFVKIKSLLKGYFADLLKLLTGVTSANIITVLLKHLHYMSPMLMSFPNLNKPIIKKLIQLWGSGEETVRVVAFLCILRIVRNQQVSLLDTTLKTMYMTYVKNSKFVSPNTLPGINFMRRSYVEMLSLDYNVTYRYVFLYIRQLAIHLRTAIMVHKKEHIQTVYNWQFVNSLRLWGNFLSVAHDKPLLQSLVYPFIQVCLGTVKLVPSSQYYPLRFHIVQILIDLSKETGVFIPILPFLLEVLRTYDFNKKHTKVSMKPMQFTCILRLSKSQLSENGFKDAVIDTIYGQLLEYLSNQSFSMAFPDFTVFCVVQIKKFIKTCKNVNFCKKFSQILEKIQQTNEFIEQERRNVSFNLTDTKQIEAWERSIKDKGTPLSIYYENWNKIRTMKKNKQATDNEKLGDYKLPLLKKIKSKEKSKSDEAPNPFPSDSESEGEPNFGDSDDNGKEGEVVKNKRGVRGGKKRSKNKKGVSNEILKEVAEDNDGEKEDVIEDINISDW